MRINSLWNKLIKKLKNKRNVFEYDENGTGKMEIEEIINIFNVNNINVLEELFVFRIYFIFYLII